MKLQGITNGARSSKVTVDFDNFRKLGEIEDDILINGLQWFGEDSDPVQCVIAFDMETFYRALKNWNELKRDDSRSDRIVGITRLERYKYHMNHPDFAGSSPDICTYKSIDFVFFKK